MSAHFGLYRLQRGLCARTAPIIITLLSVALLTPCLFSPLVIDDNIFELLSRSDPGIRGFRSRPLNLLTFTTGVVDENRSLMDEGALLPWYSQDRHLNALFRPISVLTHRLDMLLWKDSAFAMHAHSLLWFVFLLVAVSKFYSSLKLDRFTSTLAFLIFAIDETHGVTVSWIANRNAIVAAAFGTAALLFHHRYRGSGDRLAAVLAPVCIALSLGGAESGITIYAYLFAYALCIDGRNGLRSALISLWPYVLIFVGWKLVYEANGFGTFASEVYIDPVKQPGAFISALFWNLPTLLASQFGPGIPFADMIFWAPNQYRPLVLAFSVLVVVGFVWLISKPLQVSAESRFFGLGLLLAAIPVSASAAGDRQLLQISIGGSALCAQIIVTLVDTIRNNYRSGFRYRLALTMAIFFYLVVAPIMLPVRAYSMALLGRSIDQAAAAIPSTSTITDKTVVIVNAPVDVFVSYIQLSRARTHTPRPKHLYWLAVASSPFSIVRNSATTLRLEKPLGLLYSLPERHYRASWLPFTRGQRVVLSELSAEIVELTPDDRPQTIDFIFRKPLESSRYMFFFWDGSTFRQWDLPKDKHPRRFDTENLFTAMVN